MGHLELIFGSMYSGKTEELLRRLRRAAIAGQKCQVFKPSIDTRYDKYEVCTHDLVKEKAQVVSSAQELLDGVLEETKIVGIDEVQFFDHSIVEVIRKLMQKNKVIIATGLDMYSSGKPFGSVVPELACIAKYVDKLHAVCVKCGETAYISYKINDTITSSIDIGSTDKYVALCEKCFAQIQREDAAIN